jgi:hypothetical protein
MQMKQDLIAENAAIKDELYNYLKEELRKQTHELSVLREIIAEKDRAALSMQMQLEKIVAELEKAVIQALQNQERITMQLEAKVKNLEKFIELQNQDAELRDDAQNLADKDAADREEKFARALEAKDVLIVDLRKQLQQNLIPSAVVKKAVSNSGHSGGSWW